MVNDTALLVIDMQVGIVASGHQTDELVTRLVELVAEARAAETPVIFVQHEELDWPSMRHGGSDWQIHPALTPDAGELVVHKRVPDAFQDTPLREALASHGVRHLVVTGMQTDICVNATCRRAVSAGFDVTLVADGHSTEDSESLSAAQIIANHNRDLAQIAQLDHAITVRPRAEITF